MVVLFFFFSNSLSTITKRKFKTFEHLGQKPTQTHYKFCGHLLLGKMAANRIESAKCILAVAPDVNALIATHQNILTSVAVV